jgi:hypothetical protein
LPPGLHIDLDGAWRGNTTLPERVDATEWGPALRFCAPSRLIEGFYREFEARLSPFLVYGSGDFHHLTALWIRKVAEPVVLVSFDNHPDWAITPPKWACGGWVNRALELGHVQLVSVWGCGNFECWWPHQIFGNRRAEREGRLEVHPWADDRPSKDRGRRGAILRSDWQEHFQRLAERIRGKAVYVTIDLDCLAAGEAVTNWENGRFRVGELAWALTRLRETCRIVAGDICGAFSQPIYARWTQRMVAGMDHPKLTPPSMAQTNEINFATLEKVWPLLAQ